MPIRFSFLPLFVLMTVVSCRTATAPPAATSVPPASPPVATTAGGNNAIPVPDLSGVPARERDEGDSTITAVSVPKAAPGEGVEFENRWIYKKYGRFRRAGGGTGLTEGRRYDVVKIELPDGTFRTIFFDITENWDAWQPQ